MSRRSYGRRTYSQRGYATDAGLEAARRQIQEAREFSAEIGGHDEDVKQYFFSLRGGELNEVLSAYGRAYGSNKEAYARDALPRWKSGQTKMGGEVAKRLFGLLPQFMPLNKKYELAGNLWRHFGPSSNHSFVVGEACDINQIGTLLAAKLEETVLGYEIPDSIKRRFSWLAGSDVHLQEEMLNHFRQLEKKLVLEKLSIELPVLQRHMQNSADFQRAQQRLQIHKHVFTIAIVNGMGTEVKEGFPPPLRNEGSTWIWWVVGAGVALLMLILASS